MTVTLSDQQRSAIKHASRSDMVRAYATHVRTWSGCTPHLTDECLDEIANHLLHQESYGYTDEERCVVDALNAAASTPRKRWTFDFRCLVCSRTRHAPYFTTQEGAESLRRYWLDGVDGPEIGTVYGESY